MTVNLNRAAMALALVLVAIRVIDVVALVRGEGLVLYYHLDLDVYRGGGRAVTLAQELYSGGIGVAGGQLPFTYPPFAAVLFAPLAGLPWPVLSVAWTALLAAGTWWCARLIAPEWPWAAALLLLCEPLDHNLALGQINILLAAAVLYDSALPRHHRWRGVATGLAVAVKLTPLVFVAALVFHRDLRAAARALATAGLATALAFIALPADSLEYWTTTLLDPSRIGSLEYVSNQSLRGVLARALPGHGDIWWFTGVAAVGAVLAVAMYRHRADPLALTLLASLAALLGSPVSWTHHFLWLPLGALYLAYHGRWAWAGMVWLVAAARLPYLVPHGGGAEHHWQLWHAVVGNSYAWVCVALALGAAVHGSIAGGRKLQER
ncbi:hypothetical protein CPHO_04145 [Corynebacterium phocae]|uniref:Alpha-1,2-mannosyltransferase n=1 Tax=Corynebacterium phocae TaxID=161895 RepID=A0A1L7D2K4_9CORY|nr:glycosyltransferase 87 family protein [Corynebacterium phocae]APT92212.1 hypothetical protein CPHO_04145 [Corynebacterium phocae]KAA8725792.1 DUF2029 domain-containing protein [Corynebacterium phocae]